MIKRPKQKKKQGIELEMPQHTVTVGTRQSDVLSVEILAEKTNSSRSMASADSQQFGGPLKGILLED